MLYERSQDTVVLNFKMSHSVRNYGDEINDKDNNSDRVIRTRDTQEPYLKTPWHISANNYSLVAGHRRAW